MDREEKVNVLGILYMNDRFHSLPQELQDLVWSYDPTHRNNFNHVVESIKTSGILLNRLDDIYRLPLWYFGDPLTYYPKMLKRLKRHYKKKQLKEAMRFCRRRIPRHITKGRLVSALFIYVADRLEFFDPDWN